MILCETCGKYYSCTSSLNKHLREVHKFKFQKAVRRAKIYNCTLCSTSFTAQNNLYRHRKKQHPQVYTYTCETCGSTFSSKMFLIKHLKTHDVQPSDSSEVLNFKCHLCGQWFMKKYYLIQHIRSTHTKRIAAKKKVCLDCYLLKNTSSGPKMCGRCCIQTNNEFGGLHTEVDVDEPLSIENYPHLEEILPENQYQLIEFKPLPAQLNYNDGSDVDRNWFCAKLKFNLELEINTITTIRTWTFALETKSPFCYRIRGVRQMKRDKRIFKFQLRCRHFRRRGVYTAENPACPAEMTMIVSRRGRTVVDIVLSWRHEHNHPINRIHEMQKRKPHRHVVEKFKRLFIEKKLTVSQAIKIHISDLQAEFGDGEEFRRIKEDRSIMPNKFWAYNLFYRCRKGKESLPPDDVQFVQTDSGYSFHYRILDESELSSEPVFDPLKEEHGVSELDCLMYPAVMVSSSAIKPDSTERYEDEIAAFKRICGNMISEIESDPAYFKEALDEFIISYGSVSQSKQRLFHALYSFGADIDSGQ